MSQKALEGHHTKQKKTRRDEHHLVEKLDGCLCKTDIKMRNAQLAHGWVENCAYGQNCQQKKFSKEPRMGEEAHAEEV